MSDIAKHLNTNNPYTIDTEGYTDTKAVRKDRLQSFLDQGYEVIKQEDSSDLVLIGKHEMEEVEHEEEVEVEHEGVKKVVKRVVKKHVKKTPKRK